MNTQQQPRASIFAIIFKLLPEFTAQIAPPGVGGAVAKAVGAGHAPTVRELMNLGQTEEFARLFSERLGYLVRLLEDLKEGMYLCNATDEREARRVLEEDPLFKAGFIENDFTVHRWLVAI
jgi:hypothetical protein